MQIIPSINTADFEELKELVREAKDFGADWVHLDVTDGKFSKAILWNNPKQLQKSGLKNQIKMEVHLMVNNPDEVLSDWLATGAKRLVIHIESSKNLEKIKTACSQAGAALALAINPDTPVSDLFPYKNWLRQALILAVTPGPAGQKFRMDQLEKIKVLRKALPNVKIEVDGGVNLETAELCKQAGADILISAKYVFGDPDHKKAFEELKNI